MKHILILLLTILSSLHVSAQDSWQLVWSDEFNTKGRPDEATWNYEVGFALNREAQ